MLQFHKKLKVPFAVLATSNKEYGKQMIKYFISMGADDNGKTGWRIFNNDNKFYYFIDSVDFKVYYKKKLQLTNNTTLYTFEEFKAIMDSPEEEPKPLLNLPASYAVKIPYQDAGKKLIKFLDSMGVNTSGFKGTSTEWYYTVINNQLALTYSKQEVSKYVEVIYYWESLNHIIDHYNSTKKATSCKCNGDCQCKKKLVEDIVNTTPNFNQKEWTTTKAKGTGIIYHTQEEVNIAKQIEEFKKDMEGYKKEFEKFIPYQLCPKCGGNKNITTFTNPVGTWGWEGMTFGPCDLCGGVGIIPMHKIKINE